MMTPRYIETIKSVQWQILNLAKEKPPEGTEDLMRHLAVLGHIKAILDLIPNEEMLMTMLQESRVHYKRGVHYECV